MGCSCVEPWDDSVFIDSSLLWCKRLTCDLNDGWWCTVYSWDEEGETRPPVSVVVLPLHSCFNVGVVVVAFPWLLLLLLPALATASDPLPATSTGNRTGKQAAAASAEAAEDALEPELDSLRQLGSAFAGANIEDVIQGLMLLHRGGSSDQAGEPSQLRWHGELESFKLHIGCTSGEGPGNVVQWERPGLCVDPLCQNALVVVGVVGVSVSLLRCSVCSSA